MRRRTTAVAALLALVTVQSYAADLSDRRRVCRIMHAPAKHVGEVLSFAGRYMTDHRERSVVVPIGCDRGIGVGELSPQADRVLSSVDDPLKPDRKILATFTGTLVQEAPNGSKFHNDDGVRLAVSGVTDLKFQDPTIR